MKRKFLAIFAIILLVLLTAIPVLAATVGHSLMSSGMTLLQVPNLGTTNGIGLETNNNTFYAEGRFWALYLTQWDDLNYTSYKPPGSWHRYVIEGDTNRPAFEVDCFYDVDSNTLHYARHADTVPEDTIYYRMGTPHSNGTITWAAAEQTVSITTGGTLTNRVSIVIDEAGYPWVSWVDVAGLGADASVYVETSTTNDGTWTQDVAVSEVFTIADHVAGFVQLCPIGVTGNIVELVWSDFDDSGGPNDGTSALLAQRYNDGTGWLVANETISDYGGVPVALPQAFDCYDVGTAIWCTFTEAGTGDISVRVRTAAQTWATAAAASTIYTSVGIASLPTLTAYQTNGVGQDLMCIVVDGEETVYYATHTQGAAQNAWSAFVELWTVPNVDTYITRHNASYFQDGSPLCLAWQYTYDNGVDDASDSDRYWWYDATEAAWGYYTPATNTAGNLFMQILVPIIIAMGIITAAFGIKQGNIAMAGIGILIGVVGFVLVQALLDIL